ncbi:hypothetical protein KM043_002347 [Ampulex compressa]|nr:hypothetical protein KM043_002347 [Ampulex compressa]
MLFEGPWAALRSTEHEAWFLEEITSFASLSCSQRTFFGLERKCSGRKKLKRRTSNCRRISLALIAQNLRRASKDFARHGESRALTLICRAAELNLG